MNLAQCLKKIGSKISQQDQKEVNAAYRERRRLGMDRKEAALGVIDSRVEDLQAERAKVEDIIKKAGGEIKPAEARAEKPTEKPPEAVGEKIKAEAIAKAVEAKELTKEPKPDMIRTPESIQRGFDQVKEALDLFGKKKPGQATLFVTPEPPKQKRARAEKKVKRPPREAQLDLFTGKAEHAVQPGLFEDFVKKPVKAAKKAPGKLPGKKGEVQGAGQWVEISPTGRVFEAPSAVAKNAGEIASVLQAIGKQSREVLYTVTVDKAGTILEIFEHSRGAKSASTSHPIEIAGHILNIPNADKVYFVHNHPSGDTTASPEDVASDKMVRDILSLKDIESDGLVIGGNKWRYISHIPSQVEEEIQPVTGKEKIAVVETVLKGKGPGKSVSNSLELKELLADKYDNQEGIIFFNAKNQEIGFLPWPSGDTIKKASAQILAVSEHLNASAYAINFTKPLTYENRAGFIGSFGSAFRGLLQLHEVIEEGRSWADAGLIHGLLRPGRDFAKLRSEEILYAAKPVDPEKIKSLKKDSSGISIRDIETAFPKQEVGYSQKGAYWVKISPLEVVTVKVVDKINEDSVAFEIGYGRTKRADEIIAGAYFPSTREIQISRDVGDMSTILHEKYHMLEEMGFVTNADVKTISDHIQNQAKKGQWDSGERPVGGVEDRAVFISEKLRDRSLKGPVRQILQKIADFVDALINLVKTTARGLVKKIESGKIFERPGGRPQTTVPAFQKTADRWHSQMRKHLFMKLTNGRPEVLAGQIESWAKKGMIKQEELEWSGVLEWLSEQSGKVTKQEVLDYLAVNNVRVEEVTKGEDRQKLSDRIDEIDALLQEEGISKDEEKRLNAEFDRLHAEYKRLYEDTGISISADTKFGQYVLPGGKDYKELLLTLPSKPKVKFEEWVRRESKGSYPTNTPFVELPPHMQKILKDRFQKYEMPEPYIASHWEEPNVLAHIRFDERTGPNGEKVLHISEIQSDWHAEGRKKGYKRRVLSKDEKTARMVELRDRAEAGNATLADQQEMNDLFKDRAFGAPDAPFKKTWPLLTIKRMVRYAAENGFDAVSWDTGEVQAERYDLSEQIDSLTVTPKQLSDVPMDEGEVGLTAVKDGKIVIPQEANILIIPREKLGDYVGKEIADRALTEIDKTGEKAQLSGLDLKIGGEGMKSFYDKLLPNVVNKFFNKAAWGKAKVGTAMLPVGETMGKYTGPDISIDELNKIIRSSALNASTQMAAKDVKERLADSTKTFTEAIQEAGNIMLAEHVGGKMEWVGKKIKAHSLTITQEMKTKAIHEGMPLFSIKRELTGKERAFLEKHYPEKLKVFDLAKSPSFQETLEPITEGDYTANRESSGNIKASAVTSVKRVAAEIAEGVDKYLGAISTRLGQASPKLKEKLRRLDFDTNTKHATDVKAVHPLLEKAKGMSKNDFADWDYARKNSDIKKISALIEQHGMQKEYSAYRETLDNLRKEGLDVGLEIGEIEEYAPRILKDSRGFLKAIGKAEEWPIYSRMLQKRATELGISVAEMPSDMKADIISNMILGGWTGLGGVSATKERKLKKIPAHLNKYYMNSDAALMYHLYSMRKLIEARKFFGKIPQKVAEMRTRLRATQAKTRELNKLLTGELSAEKSEELEKRRNKHIGLEKQYAAYISKYALQRDYTENIGTYVMELIENKEISPEHERIVNEILNARFHEAGTRGVVQSYKNLSYIDTMGSPISALTQIGDMAWAAYEGGFIPALKHAAKSLVGKSRITKEDVGVTRIAQEFADSGTLGNAVSKVFKIVGLEKIDSIGKESLLNAALQKYQKRAEADPVKLKKEISAIFEGETDSVIEDLLNDEISDNVKLLVYGRLLDFQPVGLSEMPQKYLDAGNGRLFYMLKTFTLKVFDAFRNESYIKIRKGDRAEKIQGLKNLVRLSMYFVLANAGADELKDWVLGRKTDFQDRVVDNILRLFGVSKFVTWKARTEGVGSALARQVLPPFKFIDSLGKDIITAGDEKGLEVIGSIPVVGKLAYWHIGRGVHKRDDLWDRRLRKKKAKLKDVEEGLEKSKNKEAYRRKHRKEFTTIRQINKLQGKLNKRRKKINKLKSKKETPTRKKLIQRLEGKRTDLIRTFFGKKALTKEVGSPSSRKSVTPTTVRPSPLREAMQTKWEKAK